MILLTLAFAYLLGCISFSWIAVKISKGTDLRKEGSGNLGAKNTLRSLGLLPALLVFTGDAAKGWLALFLAARLVPDFNLLLPAALFVMLGHLFPFWLGFHGGKGLASLVGISFYLNPWLLLTLLATAAIGLFLTKKTNPGAIIALLGLPIFFQLYVHFPWAWAWGLAMALPMLYRHRNDFPDLLNAINYNK